MYLDLDDIMASQQKVHCQFETIVPNLGRVANFVTDDIPQGAKLEIPCWLAAALRKRQRSTVNVEVPKHYQEKYRNIMAADAEVVDLNKLGPYYYLTGKHLLDLSLQQADPVARLLIETFTKRFRWLMDIAFNSVAESRQPKLDRTEAMLYKAGQSSTADFEKWRCGKSGKLQMTEMVAQSRKRKSSTL